MATRKQQKEQRGRGQIIPKGDGKWLLRIYIGRDAAKKRTYRSKSVQGTFKQAEKVLHGMLNAANTGTLTEPTKVTVQAFLEEWLASKERSVVTHTYRGYADRLRLDVYPSLGALKLAKLTSAHIDSFYGSLSSDRHLSPATIRATHTMLHQAMQRAVARRLIAHNPCDTEAIELPAVKRKETDTAALSIAQMNTVLTATRTSAWWTLWRLLLTTGLRPQEACALTWDDLLTLPDGSMAVRVHRVLERVTNGTYRLRDWPKTDSSRRLVTLSKETLSALQQHRAGQAKGILKAGAKYQRDPGFIFATGTGKHHNLRNVRRAWATDVQHAGLPHFRLYATRHTHATHLLAAGVNPKAVAERLGHANPKTLLTIYAHVLPGMAQGAADVMEQQMAEQQMKVTLTGGVVGA
jgi:integrase